MKYLIHTFDVDDNGAIITETETVNIIDAESDDVAYKIGEDIRTERNLKEPLVFDEYITNVWLLDEDLNMVKQL